eukprot:4839134-Alexandrium_andersonii.AAC.1
MCRQRAVSGGCALVAAPRRVRKAGPRAGPRERLCEGLFRLVGSPAASSPTAGRWALEGIGGLYGLYSRPGASGASWALTGIVRLRGLSAMCGLRVLRVLRVFRVPEGRQRLDSCESGSLWSAGSFRTVFGIGLSGFSAILGHSGASRRVFRGRAFRARALRVCLRGRSL